MTRAEWLLVAGIAGFALVGALGGAVWWLAGRDCCGGIC